MAKSAFFVLALCFAAVCASDVLTLTSENFDDAIKNNPTILVEFYAPWCGHCKSLAPEYEKAATSLKAAGEATVLAKVDATADRDLGEKFGVRGFPTLKFFREGVPSEYDGPREAKGIVSWIKKKSGPPAKAITTAEEAKAFQEANEVAVIASFPADSADSRKPYEKAAIGNDNVVFAYIEGNQELADSLNIATPGFTVFQQFDEGRADFDGDIADAEAVATFVNSNSLPLVIPFSNEKSRQIFGADVKVHVLVFVEADSAKAEAVTAAAKAVAKSNRGKALFVTVDKENDRILSFFGITAEDMPTVRLVTMGGQMRKYEYTAAEVTEADLSAFVDDYFAGKLKAHLKSAAIPDSQDGPVTVVVGKSFDDIVMDTTKDVLVEFYAPWCGHCKSLAPTFDKLGEKFANVPSVVIAKMDATANEHEAVEVSGFPTIKLWKADDKANPVDFSGSRDEEGFIDFLKENAAISWSFDAPAEEASGDKDEL